MDTQEQNPYNYKDISAATGMPGETGYAFPPPQNPYAPMQQQEPASSTGESKQSGLFDTLPYHEYLAKQVKEPWAASDAELTGKHFDSYVDGPIKTLIKAQLAQGNHSISKEALEDRAASIADAIKIQKRKDIEDNLGALKAHLGTLQPKDTQGQPIQPDIGPGESAANALQTGLHTTLGLAAQGLGSLPYSVSRLLNPLAPAESIQRDVEENPLTRKWQDFFFGAAQKESENAAKTNKTGKDFLSQASGTLGRLPGAILTGGMGDALDAAREKIQAGADLDTVKKNLAVDAATNVAQAFLPGGKLAVRAAKGALYAPLLQNASAILKGDATPDVQDNLLSALFGAGFSAALGRRPGAKPPAPGETAPAGTDADALAAQAAAQKGNIDVSKTAPFTALTPDHLAASKQIAQNAKAVDPEALQEHYDTIAAGMSPEEANAFGKQINADIIAAHGKDAPQIEVPDVTPTEAKPLQEGATAEQAAAPENQATASGIANEAGINAEHQQVINDALSQPVTTEVGTKKGQIGTGKQIPITFKNVLDKLAYVYSKTKNDAARTALGLELQNRGVPAAELPAYASAVSDYVKSTSNALKHHVLADDIASKQSWFTGEKPAPATPIPTQKVPLPKGLGGKRGPKA